MEKKTSVIRLEAAIAELNESLQEVIGQDANIYVHADLFAPESYWRTTFDGFDKEYIANSLNTLNVGFSEMDGIIANEERIRLEVGNFKADINFKAEPEEIINVDTMTYTENDLYFDEVMSEDMRSEERISSFGLKLGEAI